MIKKIFGVKYLLLSLIILLAFMLRFWNLSSYPALNADEASIGYDAYSLLQTGRDQHGNSWPIDFQSFNDYKPGLYVYMVLPFVKVLGLTELAVRIPNAFIGVLTIPIVYFLVLELFKKRQTALIAALFLAISPWHIHFSRGGWEANIATFFITTGVLMFVKGIDREKQNTKYLILSVIFFITSMYTYQATRVVAPLLGLVLIVIYHKEIFKDLRKFITIGVVGFILLIPLLIDFTHGEVLNRAAGVGLFADPGPRSRVEEQRGEHGQYNNSVVTKAVHNKVVNYTLAFLDNWGKHFHGEFLFLSGDMVTRNKVPETGQLYIVDAVFIAVGIIAILRKRTGKAEQIIFLWIIVGPIASALTFQAPSALRAENLVIPFVIISALGVTQLIAYFSNRKVLYLLIGLLILWSFTRYEQMYWMHMSKEYSYSSQYGVKELVNYLTEQDKQSLSAVADKYNKILVTDRYDQPYILFLFYMKYSPAKFQSEHNLTQKDQFGLSTVNHFGKYYFASIKYDEARVDNPNTMIVGTNEEIPREANIVKNIYGNNGFLYFKVVAN